MCFNTTLCIDFKKTDDKMRYIDEKQSHLHEEVVVDVAKTAYVHK